MEQPVEETRKMREELKKLKQKAVEKKQATGFKSRLMSPGGIR